MIMARVLTVMVAAVQLSSFQFSGYGSLSDSEKAFWHLRLFTSFLAALIFLATLCLPTTRLYSQIDISASAREPAFQDLVRNQQQMGHQLDQLREVLYFVFLMLMVYLFGVAAFMGRLWRERQRLAFVNKPENQKPLGLETG